MEDLQGFVLDTNYGRHFNAAIVGLIEGPRVAKQTWFGESLLWVTLLHEAMEDAQAGRKESHFSLRFPFLSFTRHRRLNNCCRTTTRWQIEVRVMIARIKTRFHLPAERTEIQSDLHYQSTETPNVLDGLET